MFNITNHALDRYTTRILKLELDEEEYSDLMKDMGVDIIETITDMLRNSDMIFTHNGTGYFLYRNVAIIVKDDCVITLYEVHNEFEELADYVNYINTTQESIKTLTKKHQQARFDKDSAETNKIRLRLGQYEDWFFNNKMADCK